MSDTTTTTKTIDVWRDSLAEQVCTGRTCGRTITWARVVKSGARMCFSGTMGDLLAVSTLREGTTHAEVLAVPFDRNHWATCPDANSFKRKKK